MRFSVHGSGCAFFYLEHVMMNEQRELIYRIDGNQGKVLKVYKDGCVIEPSPFFEGKAKDCGGGASEFAFSEIAGLRFRNLSFFLSGYIKFELKSDDNWFFFAAFGSSASERMRELMAEVHAYIDEKRKRQTDDY